MKIPMLSWIRPLTRPNWASASPDPQTCYNLTSSKPGTTPIGISSCNLTPPINHITCAPNETIWICKPNAYKCLPSEGSGTYYLAWPLPGITLYGEELSQRPPGPSPHTKREIQLIPLILGVIGSLSLSGASWGVHQAAIQNLAWDTAQDLLQVS